MSKKRKNKKVKETIEKDVSLSKKPEDLLFEKISKAAEGLNYISETDAELLPFVGNISESVSKEEILNQTKNSDNSKIEEMDFAEFFERLIKIRDWFGEEQSNNARKFAELKDLLEKNLRDIKVFRIGSIQIDIYAVGLSSKNILMGIKTKAVET